MSVAVCPKPETLAAFIRGELAEQELAAVAGHVGGCEACCRVLQLIPNDSLAGLARAAAVEPPTVHSVGPPRSLTRMRSVMFMAEATALYFLFVREIAKGGTGDNASPSR